jgi:hypothetical protein
MNWQVGNAEGHVTLELLCESKACDTASHHYCEAALAHVCPVSGSRALWGALSSAYPSLVFGFKCLANGTAAGVGAVGAAGSGGGSTSVAEHEVCKGRILFLEDDHDVNVCLRALQQGVTWQTADQHFALWASLWRGLDPKLVTPRAASEARTYPPPPGMQMCATTDAQEDTSHMSDDMWTKQQVSLVRGLLRLLAEAPHAAVAENSDYCMYPWGACLASTRVVDVGNKDTTKELLALQRTLVIAIRALSHSDIMNADDDPKLASSVASSNLMRLAGSLPSRISMFSLGTCFMMRQTSDSKHAWLPCKFLCMFTCQRRESRLCLCKRVSQSCARLPCLNRVGWNRGMPRFAFL